MKKLARKLVPLKAANTAVGGRAPSFRLLQWNTLADGLAQNGDFVKVPPGDLEWSSRWPLIVDELKDSKADILCMQEVNRFDDFFKPELDTWGYEGIFFPKSGSPATQYGYPKDGSAIFFKRSRFSLVNKPVGRSYEHDEGSPMKQGLLLAHLHDCLSKQNLIVVSTHLKAKNGKRNEETRKKEVQQMLHWVEESRNRLVAPQEMTLQIRPDSNSSRAAPPPVVVCGDFNTTPDSSTCETVSGHNLGLESLWDREVLAGQEEELLSTFKFRSSGMAKRVIDYIWIAGTERLEPVRRWQMPSEVEIGQNGLPGPHYGSDHVAVMVEFEWCEQASLQ